MMRVVPEPPPTEAQRAETRANMRAGCEAAIVRLEAELAMYGATPRNGLPFWESVGICDGLRIAITHLRGRICELTPELAD